MPDELSVDDVETEIADRGADGDLLPETHEIEWRGETRTVKTKPITTGLLNELSSVDDAIADLDPEAVHEAFQTIYVTDAIRELSVQQIDDMRARALNDLLEPLEQAVVEEFGEEAVETGGEPGNRQPGGVVDRRQNGQPNRT